VYTLFYIGDIQKEGRNGTAFVLLKRLGHVKWDFEPKATEHQD
jgi:hypothetical protein